MGWGVVKWVGGFLIKLGGCLLGWGVVKWVGGFLSGLGGC